MASARFTKGKCEKRARMSAEWQKQQITTSCENTWRAGRVSAHVCVSMRGVYSYLFFYNSYFGFRPTDQPTDRKQVEP